MPLPNILITGTPGTGKSSHANTLVEKMNLPGLKHIDVNIMAKEEGLYDGFDQVRNVHILDDDKICDSLEEKVKHGGVIVDTHSMVDYFPQRWFDLVVVLKTNNTILYDRLEKRSYPASKISENVQAEIMQVLEDEARGSYDAEIVQVLRSDSVEDLENNVDRIALWIQAFLQNNQ